METSKKVLPADPGSVKGVNTKNVRPFFTSAFIIFMLSALLFMTSCEVGGSPSVAHKKPAAISKH